MYPSPSTTPARLYLKRFRWQLFAATIVAIASLVIWHCWPAHQKAEIRDVDQMKRREAMAFVLGWQSKMMLVQTTPDRPMRFYLMNLYMEQLGVRLPHPLEYFMNDASHDQGARAQAFAEETLKQLSGN